MISRVPSPNCRSGVIGLAIAGNAENDRRLSPWQEAVGHEVIRTHTRTAARTRQRLASRLGSSGCCFRTSCSADRNAGERPAAHKRQEGLGRCTTPTTWLVPSPPAPAPATPAKGLCLVEVRYRAGSVPATPETAGRATPQPVLVRDLQLDKSSRIKRQWQLLFLYLHWVWRRGHCAMRPKPAVLSGRDVPEIWISAENGL